jgi:hypothetical protein
MERSCKAAEHAAEMEVLRTRHAAEVSRLKAELRLALRSQREASPVIARRDPSEENRSGSRMLSVNVKLGSPETHHAKAFQARAEAGRVDLEDRLASMGHRVDAVLESLHGDTEEE